MKKVILWILLIVLIGFALFIIYLKYDDSKNLEEEIDYSDMIVDKDKKILSVWDSSDREIYSGDELLLEERFVISLVFYETTVKICVSEEDSCEELDYIENDEELNITESDNISFSGVFKKVDSSNTGAMILEQINDDGNKVVYYFYQPAG